MSAAKRNLNIERGAEKSFSMQIKNPDGTVVSLAGSTFSAQIRAEHRRPLVAQFNCPVVGDTVAFQLPNSATLALDVSKRYKWDAFWRVGSTNRRILYGDVIVTPNITAVAP